ncbi:acyltransferase family protein [Microbacterium aureliae]
MTATSVAADAGAPPASGRPSTVAAPRTARIAEIDGLRAVALTLVVVFHLFGQGRVSGGVDVFLFVSGVVLALSLGSAIRAGEQGRLVARWSRVFGRLAPPAAVVLGATLVMTFVLLPPWTRSQTVAEIISAALYLENWQLIGSQLAYGAAGPLTSPVQHFWSLSIQGQFFLILPAVVALVCAMPGVRHRPTVALWAAAALGTIASFAYAVVRNAEGAAAAYFDTLARAWEVGAGLLVGGIIGLGAAKRMPVPAVSGWFGLVLILASGFVLDGAAAYPGAAALVPVGGAALVVLSVSARGDSSAARVLRSRALAGLTKISYSLYLWHWPVLIGYLALRGRVDGRLGPAGGVLVLALSVALAALTWWVLERPLSARTAARGRARGLAPALAAIAVVPIVAAGVQWSAHALRPTVEAGGCHGAAAADPDRPECADAWDATSSLLPAVESLASDDANRPECWAGLGSEDFAMCRVGPESGYTKHLLAVGDSHSNALIGAYEQIARAHGWRIDIAGRAGCHWTDLPREQPNRALTRRCADWNEDVDRFVAQTPLDAILVTNSSKAEYVVPPGESLRDARAAGHASAWAARSDPATPVIAIRDNPLFGGDALTCVLDRSAVTAGACSLPRADALRDDGLADAVERDAYAHLVDLNGYMCDTDRCHMVVGGVITTRDGAHLTATYARTLAPYLDREIAAVVGG